MSRALPARPIVGMVHLAPLPGAPGYAGDFGAVLARAAAAARALAEGGVTALLVENFGDRPFHPGRVPASTVAHLTAAAAAVRDAAGLPLGINVLRNDGEAALGIAQAVGAAFVRINILTGARVTDQGVIEGRAHAVLRLRRTLGAEAIRIFADVDVKHSAPLAPRPLAEEVADTLSRGGADGLIVSGSGTGAPVDPDVLETVQAVAGDAPVWVGSGVTPATAGDLLRRANGLIVGTALKEDGRVDRPVDPERVRALITAVDAASDAF